MQHLINESFITKEQQEKFKETFKDLVMVVRCKDCKHGSLYCTEDVCGETLIECNRPDLGDVIEIHGWKWFCADGEPKDKQLAHADNGTAQYADSPTMMSAT